MENFNGSTVVFTNDPENAQVIINDENMNFEKNPELKIIIFSM
jgi:hypothetical protein